MTSDGNPRRKLPEFLREDKPLGLRPSVWQLLIGGGGQPVARRNPPLPEMPDARHWPQWAKVRLNLADLRGLRVGELVRSLSDPERGPDSDGYHAAGLTWDEPLPQFPHWWLDKSALVPGLVIAGLAVAYLAMLYFVGMFNSPVYHPTTEPMQKYGGRLVTKPLAGVPHYWRELGRWPNPSATGYAGGEAPLLALINSDDDPGCELFLQLPSQFTSGPRLLLSSYDLDGTVRQWEAPLPDDVRSVIPWDGDGAGLHELALDRPALDAVYVSAADGNVISRLPGVSLASRGQAGLSAVADVDGDGRLELLVAEADGKLGAHRLDGSLAWSSPGAMSPQWAVPGDIDGDGRDEILYMSGNTALVYGLSEEAQGWSLTGFDLDVNLAASPLNLCADLNGDGVDEVIIPDSGFLNPETGVYTTLDRGKLSSSFTPVGYYDYGATAPWASAVAVGDLSGDGLGDIAVLVRPQRGFFQVQETVLYVFDYTGTLVYSELFHARCWSLAVIADEDGGNHLAVLLDDRLLLWP